MLNDFNAPQWFVYPVRNADGSYMPDAIQQQAVADILDFFEQYLKPNQGLA